MPRTAFRVAVLVALSAGARAQTTAVEWPQLFGPSRNSTATVPMAGANLSVAWKKAIPSGGAGLVVAGDRVYTLGSDGDTDVLFAFNAATGDEAWRLALGKTHADAAANGPNATPVVAGHLLLTVSSACQLQAVNTQTRQVAWTQDLGATYGSRFAKRGGCNMAPQLAGSRVILLTGGPTGPRLVALDVATGKPSWAVTDIPNSSGLAPGWMDGGGGHILYHHSKPPGVSGITAINAQTGAVSWQIDGKDGESDATPVPAGQNRVLLETWQHVTLYDIAARTPVWTSKEIAAARAPAIFHKGHLYTFGGQSGEFLTCVDAATGQSKWTSRIYRGHLALAGDTLVVLSESSGLLRLVAADSTAYRELAQVRVLAPGARTGTPPSIAGGRIFVRNLEEIVAVAVR